MSWMGPDQAACFFLSVDERDIADHVSQPRGAVEDTPMAFDALCQPETPSPGRRSENRSPESAGHADTEIV